jgi:hypothetical protein
VMSAMEAPEAMLILRLYWVKRRIYKFNVGLGHLFFFFEGVVTIIFLGLFLVQIGAFILGLDDTWTTPPNFPSPGAPRSSLATALIKWHARLRKSHHTFFAW